MKFSARAVLGAALLCSLAAGAPQRETCDVVKGASKAIVVLPGDVKGKLETVRAAMEVSEYLGKITGREIAVVSEGQGAYVLRRGRRRFMPFAKLKQRPSGKPEIHVGWTTAALKAVDKARVDKLDVDGHVVKVTRDAVYLVGPSDLGTAYACFTFLEDLCGVRWFLPGEFGEDVPRRETLSVPVGETVHTPAYGHRQFSGFGWRDRQKLKRWGLHQRVRRRLYYHHNLYRVFDAAKYAKKYPDVYPIIGKRRRIPDPGIKAGWQPCLTHPKAVDIAMEYARAFFKRDPGASSISLGVNDGDRHCECARCLKQADKTVPRQGERSRIYFNFANQVAERFDREFPNKQIGYLLYGRVKLFPEKMKTHPRLIGFYVTPSFNLITPEGKEAFDQGLADLTRSVSRFALYDWFYGATVTMPRLQIRQAKYYLEHGYKMGARHLKAEAYMNWGLDGFKYWIYTRLLWDPSRDVDAMMNEFFARFFKESAKPMREYFRIVEEYTVKPVVRTVQTGKGSAEKMVNFRFKGPEQFASFPPEAVRRCEPLLERAEAKAQSFIVRERVRYFRQAFNVTKMMTLNYHDAERAVPLLGKPETLAEGLAILAQTMRKDRDVPQYYSWVLRGDPFCVRYPETTTFAPATRARSVAATALARTVVDDLAKAGRKSLTVADINAVTQRVLSEAYRGITDGEALKVVKLEVAPVVAKILLCRRTAPPKMDGRLDDACWKQAPAYGGFAGRGTGKATQFPTELRMVHDGERLYGGVTCHQDTSKLIAWTKERDGRLWKEDGVEFLLNKRDHTKPEQNFQIILNTRGNIFDYFKGSGQWDGDIRVKIAKAPKFYTIEFSVPLKDIGIDPTRDRFVRINLVRNVFQKRGGRPKPREISNWYVTPFGNRDPRARGWMVFN